MLKSLLRALMRTLFRVEIRGRTDVFGHARTLIVANHESFLDGLLLGLFLPVEPVFVVHTQVAVHPVFGRILRHIEH
ncbi:MAG TPA: 1-acyl-sn-glycerol-3-phosphate acyltransferase, partial [Plasticicumulans sp.]|nr:1-acyl-sn-glycerol-3-phosphate acyltransferase [Plasticicumulans sp.]